MDDPFAPRQDPYDIPDRTAPGGGSPTMGGGTAVNVPGAAGSGGASAMLIDDPASLVRYNCGDCQAIQRFARGATMRCTECGGRMFYKERTKRMVQFEAR
jgi:DNA-directed RNA polymerase subunit RPC12/RpoP